MNAIHSRSIALAIGLLAAGAIGAPASAATTEEHATCPICSKANDASAPYAERAGHELARGALNLTLGWTELIRQPAKKARKGGNVFLGMATGVSHSVVRTARGLGEILTFWTPKNTHLSDDCPLDTMQ